MHFKKFQRYCYTLTKPEYEEKNFKEKTLLLVLQVLQGIQKNYMQSCKKKKKIKILKSKIVTG